MGLVVKVLFSTQTAEYSNINENMNENNTKKDFNLEESEKSPLIQTEKLRKKFRKSRILFFLNYY